MKVMGAIGLAGFALLLCTGGPADAMISTQCPGGPAGPATFTVPTQGSIPDGYSNTACTIIITASIGITPNLGTFKIQAKGIKIQGTGGAPVEIVNDKPGGSVVLAATGGDVAIDHGSIKARGQVNISCSLADCTITVTESELVASSTMSYGADGGILLITAKGDASITGTAVWGGGLFRLSSLDGSATFRDILADPEGAGCKDPTVPPFTDFVKQHCVLNEAKTEIISCTFTAIAARDLKAICCPPAPCPDCSPDQWDITAKLDIHIENSVITPNTVLGIASKNGRIFGSGATIYAARLSVEANGDGTVSPVIDFKAANITVTKALRVVATACPLAPSVCIDLTGATVSGDPITIAADRGHGVVKVCAGRYESLGSKFPAINGVGGTGAAPLYTALTTIYQAGQCPSSGGAGTFIHH